MMRKIFLFVLGLIIVFFIGFCFIRMNDLSIINENIELYYGEERQIKTNYSSDLLLWKSSNPSLLSVDSNGKIKAISNIDGIEKITVETKDGKHSASINVKIKKVDMIIDVTGIEIEQRDIELKYGESIQLKANVLPSNASDKTLMWKSSNPSLLSVDSNGKIKAISNIDGSEKITVETKDGKHSTSINVKIKKHVINVPVNDIKINNGYEGTIYYNKTKKLKFTAIVSPNNATNKSVIWSSSDSNVATIDNDGNVLIKDIGITTISVKTVDGGFVANYKLSVKKKVIVVITASLGVRMNKWFTEYSSSNGNYYSKEDNTLNYIYKSGSGFSYQYGEGLQLAKEKINSIYSGKKNYIDLFVYFTLTGNSARHMTCDQIKVSNDYVEFATRYNNSIKEFIDSGYTNTIGYVISHSPLNTKHAIGTFPKEAAANKIVYSTSEKACLSGYRSAYKYWISNRKMEEILKSGNYKNISFVDYSSNFVVLTNEESRKFTWKKNEQGISYVDVIKTTDALHWDENTTKICMKHVFDDAGM